MAEQRASGYRGSWSLIKVSANSVVPVGHLPSQLVRPVMAAKAGVVLPPSVNSQSPQLSMSSGAVEKAPKNPFCTMKCFTYVI